MSITACNVLFDEAISGGEALPNGSHKFPTRTSMIPWLWISLEYGCVGDAAYFEMLYRVKPHFSHKPSYRLDKEHGNFDGFADMWITNEHTKAHDLVKHLHFTEAGDTLGVS